MKWTKTKDGLPKLVSSRYGIYSPECLCKNKYDQLHILCLAEYFDTKISATVRSWRDPSTDTVTCFEITDWVYMKDILTESGLE